MADDIEPKPTTTPADAPPPAEATPPATAVPEPEKSDWRIIELGQTRRQLEERQAELQRVQDENRRMQQLLEAAQRRGEPPPARHDFDQRPPGQEPQVVPPRPDSDFDQKVQQAVQARITADKAAQLDAALRTNFAEDYPAIVNNFGNVQNSIQLMFEDIVETGEGAYVAATIGKNPAEIQRLRDMPPAQRRMALLRIALDKPKPTAEPPKPVTTRPSDAPPPPAPPPRGGAPGLPTGAVDIYDQRFDFKNYYSGEIDKEMAADDTWFAERRRQKLESIGRAWSLRK